MSKKLFILTAIFTLLLTNFAFAQDAQELEAERIANEKLKGEHPLFELMRTKNSTMKPELKGVHPRVYLSQKDLDALKEKTKTQPELWADGSFESSRFNGRTAARSGAGTPCAERGRNRNRRSRVCL